jgi:hypothetical protein
MVQLRRHHQMAKSPHPGTLQYHRHQRVSPTTKPRLALECETVCDVRPVHQTYGIKWIDHRPRVSNARLAMNDPEIAKHLESPA